MNLASELKSIAQKVDAENVVKYGIIQFDKIIKECRNEANAGRFILWCDKSECNLYAKSKLQENGFVVKEDTIANGFNHDVGFYISWKE